MVSCETVVFDVLVVEMTMNHLDGLGSPCQCEVGVHGCWHVRGTVPARKLESTA